MLFSEQPDTGGRHRESDLSECRGFARESVPLQVCVRSVVPEQQAGVFSGRDAAGSADAFHEPDFGLPLFVGGTADAAGIGARSVAGACWRPE